MENIFENFNSNFNNRVAVLETSLQISFKESLRQSTVDMKELMTVNLTATFLSKCSTEPDFLKKIKRNFSSDDIKEKLQKCQDIAFSVIEKVESEVSSIRSAEVVANFSKSQTVLIEQK